MRVLVVDDEPDIRFLIKMLLEADGHEVLFAEDGAGALTAARNDRPDLLLLDVRIPPPDGWEVLRRVKSDEELREGRVVMMSAHSSDSSLSRATKEGAEAYLVKPFTRQELLDIVRKHGPADGRVKN